MMQQVERDGRRFESDIFLLVFKDDVVHTGPRGLACLAERHLHTRDVLQFDCNMFEHMPKPRPFVFRHATNKSAGFTVRAAMLLQSGQRIQQ